MPGMSGTELGQELAKLWPSTPVLYMSGFTFSHDLKTATSGNEKLLLQKPFRKDDLVHALQRAAERS